MREALANNGSTFPISITTADMNLLGTGKIGELSVSNQSVPSGLGFLGPDGTTLSVDFTELKSKKILGITASFAGSGFTRTSGTVTLYLGGSDPCSPMEGLKEGVDFFVVPNLMADGVKRDGITKADGKIYLDKVFFETAPPEQLRGLFVHEKQHSSQILSGEFNLAADHFYFEFLAYREQADYWRQCTNPATLSENGRKNRQAFTDLIYMPDGSPKLLTEVRDKLETDLDYEFYLNL